MQQKRHRLCLLYTSFDEYVQVIEALEDAPVDAYEVNISCPNVDAGGMTIGTHVESCLLYTSRCV